jgi:pSer/pThr/pTyr-binding forkhead associated (FHA) protein
MVKPFIQVGRGHDNEMRVTDISVSRCHAKLAKGRNGEVYLEDYGSKFGTMI